MKPIEPQPVEAQLEWAQGGLLEILAAIQKDGAYADWDHLMEVMQGAGIPAKEILKT